GAAGRGGGGFWCPPHASPLPGGEGVPEPARALRATPGLLLEEALLGDLTGRLGAHDALVQLLDALVQRHDLALELLGHPVVLVLQPRDLVVELGNLLGAALAGAPLVGEL